MGLALQRRRHSVPLRPQDRYDEAVGLLRAVHYGFETRIFGGFKISGFKTKLIPGFNQKYDISCFTSIVPILVYIAIVIL